MVNLHSFKPLKIQCSDLKDLSHLILAHEVKTLQESDGWNLSPSKADSSFAIHFCGDNLDSSFGLVQWAHVHITQGCLVLAAAGDHAVWCSRINSKQAHDRSLSSKGFMLFYLQEDEIMPVRFDENSLIWVAADEPIKHNNFLSPKILELCGDLPIFWLRPTYPKGTTSVIWKLCYPSLHLNTFPKSGVPPRLAHLGNQDPFSLTQPVFPSPKALVLRLLVWGLTTPTRHLPYLQFLRQLIQPVGVAYYKIEHSQRG